MRTVCPVIGLANVSAQVFAPAGVIAASESCKYGVTVAAARSSAALRAGSVKNPVESWL